MLRTVDKVVTAHQQREGGGFIVRRPLPTAGIDLVDPFLMIDEMGPIEYGPGEAVGAPAHPHRGFETVTYILSGSAEHRDSMGNHGVLEPGDVQWMTAGSGVVHAEMPSEKMRTQGGRVHGFQIWVNLPRAHKMTRPRYQQRAATEIPTATSDDGLAWVRVIAGKAMGVDAGIETFTPIQYLHYALQPGASVTQGVPPSHNALVYVFEGAVAIGKQQIQRGQMAVLSAGDAVRLNGTDGGQSQLLFLSGVPLNEPVARYGPFVMNAVGEIKKAMLDYSTGQMGTIAPEVR
ncbi:MAG: pirin family protein [Myxococcota bacterium]